MWLHVERRRIALSSERVRVKGNQLACLHAIRKTSVYMFGIKLCWNFPVHTHTRNLPKITHIWRNVVIRTFPYEARLLLCKSAIIHFFKLHGLRNILLLWISLLLFIVCYFEEKTILVFLREYESTRGEKRWLWIQNFNVEARNMWSLFQCLVSIADGVPERNVDTEFHQNHMSVQNVPS